MQKTPAVSSKGFNFRESSIEDFHDFSVFFYILFECFTGHHRIPVKKFF